MLVGAVGSWREFLLSHSLTVFQGLGFSRHALLVGSRAAAILVFEEAWGEIEQVFCRGTGGEIHTVDVVGVGVYLAVQLAGYADLVLQDGLAFLAQEYAVTALSCRALHHQESQLLG